jgi:hypothetical protein
LLLLQSTWTHCEQLPHEALANNITNSLGQPIILEAYRLGSTALKKTAIWTNSANTSDLRHLYESSKVIGDTLPLFLYKNKFHDWHLTPQTGEYLPNKFMARPNSWGYSLLAVNLHPVRAHIRDNRFRRSSGQRIACTAS